MKPGGGGQLRFVVTDNGVVSNLTDANVDFATVTMGTRKSLTLSMINLGSRRMSLQTFIKVEGDATNAGPQTQDENAVFIVGLEQAIQLPVGETIELPITFAPPVIDGEPTRAYRVVLRASTEDHDETIAASTLTLTGNAISGECEVPERLDFGAVAIGDTASMQLAFENPRDVEAAAYLGAVESQQGAIFTASAESPRGDFIVAPNSTRSATFTFKPTLMSEFLATVRVRRSANCPERVVRLVGVGMNSVLTWTPVEVNFGYAPPQTTVERDVVFSNFSMSAVTLSALKTADQQTPNTASIVFKTVDPSDTLVVPEATRDVDGMLRPGLATLKLSFKPNTLGPRRGAFTANTTLRSQTSIAVQLRGVGGGPDIDVRPSPTLSLGRIAYFPDASPSSFAQSNVRIQNIGTSTVNDPEGALKLGSVDASGNRTRPYWDVVPLNGALRSEICVGTYDAQGGCDETPPLYVDSVGLASGAAITVPVRITPTGFGPREFDVKFFSNDADEPEVTLRVTANAVELPECNVAISPVVVPFGVVTPPSLRESSFLIRNLNAAGTCLITNLRMGAETGTPSGMPAIFSLPGGELTELELQPGEARQVAVRAWPQGQLPPAPTQVTGRVQFNVAHRTSAAREVTLTATLANACLTVSPIDLNFGTVQQNCSSATRNFQIYNTCSTPVTINTATMISGTEFHVVAGIAPGTTLQPGANTPTTFQLRYRPVDLGSDSGAFAINVTQAGQQMDYVVTLRGTGDTQGLNVDVFRESDNPKADILLAIDKSCSMEDEQERLAANMDSLLQFARTNGIDFHLAAINTELTEATRGEFNLSTGGRRFLTNNTPGLNAEYRSIVDVRAGGGSESCMEPATRALTAPLINDPSKNGGFLRNDAVLSVVCVTDAPDQAPQAPSFYLNQLLAIKGAQRATAFTYNVIGPFLPNAPVGCEYDEQNDSRHDFMVSQTNGVKEEICLTDWSDALERISKAAFGYRRNFFLTAQPDLTGPNPIRVEVNDMDRPAIDPTFGTTVWEYDPVTNSVVFDALYTPSRGDTLKITYRVGCLP